MKATHIIPNHTSLSALEMGLTAEIITKDCHAPSKRQRLNDYALKLDDWLAAVDAAEQCAGTSADPVITDVAVAATNNISTFLRKGGAK